MKKYFSLILAFITLLFFAGLVAKNEWHLHHSKSIFIELKPVDPRSILQGDYMALAYELHLQSLKALAGSEGEALEQVIFNRSSVPAKVILDSQNRVVRTILDINNSFAGQRLILKILKIVCRLYILPLAVSCLQKAWLNVMKKPNMLNLR